MFDEDNNNNNDDDDDDDDDDDVKTAGNTYQNAKLWSIPYTLAQLYH